MSISSLLNIFKSIVEIITNFGKEYGKKFVAILIICACLTVGICLFTSSLTMTKVNNVMVEFREDMRQDMLSTLVEYEYTKDSIRKVSELEVINRQSIIKSKLKGWLNKLDAEYILVAQFHNNVQSIAGCQFVKFDVTYNIHKKGLTCIEQDDFQNVSITKYDIIPFLWDHNFTSMSVEELEHIDELFYTQLHKYAPHVKYIAFHHLNIGGSSDGVIIYMFKNEYPNFAPISDCTQEIGALIYQ